jgi:hypothetical protein
MAANCSRKRITFEQFGDSYDDAVTRTTIMDSKNVRMRKKVPTTLASSLKRENATASSLRVIVSCGL